MKPNLSLLVATRVPENIRRPGHHRTNSFGEIPEVTICSWTGFDVEDWWRKDEWRTTPFVGLRC